MSKRIHRILFFLCLLTFAAALDAALVGKGSDGKTYISLDEEEVETLGVKMKMMADRIKHLEEERKRECNLI